MAEAGRPVSELYPGGGAVTLSGQSLCDTSRTQPAAAGCRVGGGAGCTPPQELQQERSGSDSSRVKVGGEPAQQEQSQCEHCVPLKASSPPQSLAETHTTSHRHKAVVTAVSALPQAGGTLQAPSLPVHRSHSDTTCRPVVQQGAPPQPAHTDTCGLAYHGDRSMQESPSMLACKQPMQLQQCNIITTICRGVSSAEGGPQQQQPHGRCVCVSSPKAAAKMEGVEEKGHLPPKCDMPLCYGSYNHHVNFEDTFAAYCHPQPIPAHLQLLPRVAGVEPKCDIQRAGAPPSATDHLALPRLISSVSETGLDAKHLLRCCNLSCSYVSLLPPGAAPQSQKHFGGREECCCSPVGHVRTITRDMGTMTAHKQLRDVGVQTAQTGTPHVFPQICLAEESRRETDIDGGKKSGGGPKSPVKEVKWDAEGMTWEVYGASVDPEELGLAIQKHLELQIKETAIHAAKLTRQNTNSSQQGGGSGSQRKRSKMMSSIRAPACCTRSTTAVD